MSESKCPLCGSLSFYAKDPEDPYKVYEFDLKAGEIVFKLEVNESEVVDIEGETEAYCNRCAWHDKLKTLG